MWYSRPTELNLTCKARSAPCWRPLQCDLPLGPGLKCGTPDPGEWEGRVGGVRAAWWRRQLCFTLGFAAHVLPITDKREAVPCGMWFRLEQVKQCWKIDPSSAAFQRPARNSAKSDKANPARNRWGIKGSQGPRLCHIFSEGLLTRVHRWMTRNDTKGLTITADLSSAVIVSHPEI